MQPDFVKLDMSLIRNVDRDPIRRRLVDSMVQVGHDMGILVVAEGIETEAECDVVVELGVDLLQGFLLGRPDRLTSAPIGRA
jgi:EAL domain-containing protein (putative c-di-GMP-specific phosphodiesterase class I)